MNPNPTRGLIALAVVLIALKILFGLEIEWSTALAPLWIPSAFIVAIVILFVLSPIIMAPFNGRKK